MATELGSAFISVGLGTNTLAGDIKKAFGGAEGSGADAGSKAGKGFGFGFVKIAAAAVGALGIGSVLKGAISEASGLGESVNAINVVFGEASSGVQELGKSAAKSLGLSNLEFNNLAVKFSSFAQTIAGPGGNVTGTLDDMTTRASDFASVMNLEVADAAALFQSGLAGESEPLRAFGIDLSAAAVEAFALKEGITSSAGSMTEAEKVQARYGLLMEKTSMASGDFANTSDSLANQQRILSSSWKDAQAVLGKALLPAMSAVTGALISGLGPAVAGTEKVIAELSGGFTAMGAAFKAGDGDITSSGFAGFMERVGGAAREVTGGVQAMFAAFKAGDGDITSSGFAGFMEQIGGAARTIFDGLQQTIGPLIPQILSLASAFSPMQIIFAAIQPLLPQLGAMFMQLASVLGGSLLTILTELTPMFIQLSGVVSELLGGVIAAAVLPTIVTMITMLGSTLTQLVPIIVPIISTLVQLATTLLSQLMPIITNLVASILPPLVDIFGNILGAIGPVISMIAGLLIPIIMALMPVVVTVFSVVADVVESAMQIVQGIIQVVTGIISGDWSKVWSGIQNIFSGIWDLIVSVVGGAIKIVGSVINSGLSLAANFVGSILGNIGNFFSDTWSNITRGISDFVGGIGSFFAGIPGTIQGALSAAGSWLYDSGKNIVQGLFDGIKSLASTIGNFFLGLLPGWIVEPFKIALGIASPSKVFRGLGVNIGEGLILGIDDMQGDIGNAVTGMVTVPRVPSFSSGSYTPAGAIGSGRGNTFNTTINQVDDPIGTSHAVQRRLGALAV